MPPSEVTQSASSSASPLPAASGAQVGQHAGGGLGMHGGDQLRRRVRGEHPLGVDRLPPLVLDGARPRRRTARRRRPSAAPNRPLTATTTTSPGPTVLTNAASMPGRAGRRQRQGAPVRRPEELAQPVGGLVEDPEEHRVEVPEQRAPEGDGRLRVGVGRAGSEQGAGVQRHARNLAAPPGPGLDGRGARRSAGRQRPVPRPGMPTSPVTVPRPPTARARGHDRPLFDP